MAIELRHYQSHKAPSLRYPNVILSSILDLSQSLQKCRHGKRRGPLSEIQKYRKAQLKTLSNKIGVYVLCDLDGVPVYVGQSKAGIRERVYRHLTSARSDIIANRKIDVWEIAYVQAYPVDDPLQIPQLEADLYAKFNSQKPLMNGTVPKMAGPPLDVLPEYTTVQILPDEEIRVRQEPVFRLPRQIEQIGRLVDHILTVKDDAQNRSSLAAHFGRLDAYRQAFLEAGPPVERPAGEEEEGDEEDEK